MYDVMTVAHELKWPWKNKRGYRNILLTIWHVDPEKDGTDDSCGWTFPKGDEETKKVVLKLAKTQYEQLFARKIATEEKKSYAYICYDQDVYGMIYWSWRALKAFNRSGWQYGKPLSLKELDQIYVLATNPVDNFQHHKIESCEDFERFFLLIWRCFRRFYRPWYRHPRWHIQHWRIQFIPLQNFKRRYWDKCCICGKRGSKSSFMSDWDGTKFWHQECDRSGPRPAPKARNL
jgi:hypothetical protein